MYKDIYDDMFSHEEYNQSSVKHEPSYPMVKEWIEKNPIETMIDVGSGRALISTELLQDFPNLQITTIDLGKYHKLDTEHIEVDISNPEDQAKVTKVYDLLMCNGVLEHIHAEQLDGVIAWFATICKNAFIMTADHADHQHGHDLHVTRQPESFWTDLFAKHFTIVSVYNKENFWFFYILNKAEQQ